RRRGGGGGRQQLRLADGPRGAARRSRGQPGRDRRFAPGDHRQPELLDDPGGRRAEAAAGRRGARAGGGDERPVGQRGGAGGAGGGGGGAGEGSPFSRPIAGNVVPQIGGFDEEGWTEEERKMINEPRKILSLPSLPLAATCVRVPVEVGHSVQVMVELEG